MKRMTKLLVWLGGGLLLAILINFLMPFGLPKPASPNCGPEQWAWLDVRLHSREDFITYLQAHQLELIAGTNTPRLGGYKAGVVNHRMPGVINWQGLSDQVWLKNRPGYKIYTLYFHHLACGESQFYKLEITSYGLAALYGCCGV